MITYKIPPQVFYEYKGVILYIVGEHTYIQGQNKQHKVSFGFIENILYCGMGKT